MLSYDLQFAVFGWISLYITYELFNFRISNKYGSLLCRIAANSNSVIMELFLADTIRYSYNYVGYKKGLYVTCLGEKQIVENSFSYYIFLFISMQIITDIANSFGVDVGKESIVVQEIEGRVNKEGKPIGWLLLLINDGKCIALNYNNGEKLIEGYLLNKNMVMKVLRSEETGHVSCYEESITEGIVDLDHGTRFEGYVLKESGIPFGFGSMFDDDGILVYKGILINWKRFGYGVSYCDIGSAEYEGYWCDDNRFGRGKLYDRSGKLVKECEWYNGKESEINILYEGRGNDLVYVGIKHLKLSDYCDVNNWDISWFINLESIEIGDDSFTKFKCTLLHYNYSSSFDKGDKMKSFHILNCESLESIEIGKQSFSDFGGEFELSNLKSLKSITIGSIGITTYSFYTSSLVIRGMDVIVN